MIVLGPKKTNCVNYVDRNYAIEAMIQKEILCNQV
jgi:hypothetical protein